jgi:uncharacterized protein YchJ
MEAKVDNSKSKVKKCEDLMRLFVPRTIVGSSRIPRNEPCICGSGKKFKHCCWKLFVQGIY